ncbi:MAG TPA: hypothetical protein DIW31_09510 [Bacteroidales bacterium]|nr:hypothetical protein [Bacteroidales bacterium]
MKEEKNDDYLKQVFVTQTKGFIDISLKRELWQDVSNEFNGKFIISHTSGNVLEILKINIPYKNWEIKLSESDTRPLKFEITFNSGIDYELIINYEDIVENIMKRFGRKEVELGNELFDNKYIIRSRNSEITKKLLTQEIINDFIKFNIYSLSYTTGLKKRTSNLISVISRTIEDKSTIESLIRLHMKIIDKLKELALIE